MSKIDPNKIIEMIREIIASKENRAAKVEQLFKAITLSEPGGISDEGEMVLLRLADDIDYYEADPDIWQADSSLLGDSDLEYALQETLDKLRELGYQ